MNSQKRYIEIDLLRSLAIALMVVYHTAYDLAYFWDWNFDPRAKEWWLLARMTATLFLLLVGISFAISWSRANKTPPPNYAKASMGRRGVSTHVDHRYWKYLKRATVIGAGAMAVTIATYLVDPETYVRFGILHLIATATLLLPLVARLKEWNALLGIIIIASAEFFHGQHALSPLLLPIGITFPGFQSVDYFPLFPWFGVILVGYAIGYFLYVRSPRWQQSFPIFHFPFFIPLGWPGRHALFLYLIHQPILFLLLWIILGKPNIS